MELKKVKIDELVSPNWNPRKISKREKEKLKKSIEEYGYISPVIINSYNNHIIGGNQRISVLKELGYTEIDVVYIHEPNTYKEKSLNLSLNKVNGEWDMGKLENLLVDLELSDVPLDLTGFDNLDFKELDFDIKIPKETSVEKKGIIDEVIIETTENVPLEETEEVEDNIVISFKESNDNLFDSIEYEDDTVTVYGEEEEASVETSQIKEKVFEQKDVTSKDKVNEVLSEEYKVLLTFNNKSDLEDSIKRLKLEDFKCNIQVL